MVGQADELGNLRARALASELRAVVGKLRRRLLEQAHIGDLSSSQMSVLSRLERDGPATISELARAEGMRQQSMGAIVATLQGEGYIVGAPDPEDGRRTILSLTDASLARIRASRSIREDWLYRGIQSHLSPEEQDKLAAAIGYLKRLADSRTTPP